MAYQSSFNLLHSFWTEQDMLQHTDAAYAEELQLEEALQMSIISSQMKIDESSSSMPSKTTTTWEEEAMYIVIKGKQPLRDDDDAFDDSDEYDSDSTPTSQNLDKNSKWFKEFFNKEIESSRKSWHCPACKGGPGATKWFQSLQDLITHAKTIAARRVKLHREFANLLEDEIRRKCATTDKLAVPKWKGLKEEEKDHIILWPPMVVIRNNNEWIGIENQDLLELFNSYHPIKTHHYCGISLLIFESSVAGYLDAERLHKSFSEQGLGRNASNGGENDQLYGYLAIKEDMDFHNQFSQGKSKINYAIRSYKEVIVNRIRNLSEENIQLNEMKQMFVEHRMRVDVLKEEIHVLRKKLDMKTEEVIKLRQILQQQIEEHKEEMEFQENFFKDQIEASKQEDPEVMQQLELPDQEEW